MFSVMMRRLLCLVLVAFGAAFSAPERASAGSMTLCNEGNWPGRFAMVWNEGDPLLFPRWIAAGWYHIEPGECQQILTTRLRQYVYLSFRRIAPGTGTRFLARYELRDPGPLQLASSGTYGVEIFFCVLGDAFHRQTVTLQEQQDCPDQYYGQLFTMLGISRTNTNLTMRLR